MAGEFVNDKTRENEQWRGKEYSFFSHKDCEAFPCHEIEDRENFNCLFCYCPLYFLGSDCGGKFSYTPSGVKNCTSCSIPHVRENYGYIIGRFRDIARKMKQQM